MLEDRSYMREPEWRPEAARSGVSICLVIIALNVLFFIIQSRSTAFYQSWSLTAIDIRNFELWKLVTFQFLHGGFIHLLINCLMIWISTNHNFIPSIQVHIMINRDSMIASTFCHFQSKACHFLIFEKNPCFIFI